MKGAGVKKRIMLGLIILAGVLLMALAAFGCGDSGPKAAVTGVMDAAKAKDCEKLVDYIDLESLKELGGEVTKEMLVSSCKESGMDDVVSYNILEENIDGDKAEVKVEVTAKQNGQEQTVTDTLTLINRNGEWKLTTL